MVEILNEEPLSLTEIKQILKELEKRDGTLDYRSERLKKFVELWDLLPIKKAKELKEELKSLGIEGMNEKHIIYIIDNLPENNDELRAIFYGDVTDPEAYKKILELVKKYKG